MAENKSPASDARAMLAQSLEQTRGAMENYLRFFEKGMVAMPWAKTDLNQKVMKYAEKNIATAFGYAQKLSQAKDLQEVAQIQSEFFQTQLKSLTEQAKDLGETATKAAESALKGPVSSSS